MKTTIISVSTTALNAIASVLKRHSWVKDAIELHCHYAGNDSLAGDLLTECLEIARCSDLILLDLMGVNEIEQLVISESLNDFSGSVIVTNSDKTTVRGLTRLGAFSLASMSKQSAKSQPWEEKMKKARTMMAMAEKAGTVLPVGILRDIRNYFWAVKYWRFADEYNMLNLLSLLAKEYGGGCRCASLQAAAGNRRCHDS